MMTCEEAKIALGAHALGALDPEEALEMDTHLATCPACGAELEELESVASFLGKVSERDVELVASPPRQVLDRLLNDRARRSRRGRRLTAVAAAAAVLIVGGTVWTLTQTAAPQQETTAAAPASTGQEDRAEPYIASDSEPGAVAKRMPSSVSSSMPSPSRLSSIAPRTNADGRAFSGENHAKEIYATVTARPADAGTELGVSLRGVPFDTTCSLVVVSADGLREATESWVVSRESYQDRAVFMRTTSMNMADIARFEVVDQTGRVLVKVQARK
ncbi:anti-sigma factor family protein [Nonomuraea sp. NPDC002799]